MVARGVETEWNTALRALADAQTEPVRREKCTTENPYRSRESSHLSTGRVHSLRHHYQILCHTPTGDPQHGELLTVTAVAAEQLGLAPSTLHRRLGDGFITGEQLTPGAPWRIRLTDQIRNPFVDNAPNGWLAMPEATLAYGVSRQTFMQHVKHGELKAVHVRTGVDAGEEVVGAKILVGPAGGQHALLSVEAVVAEVPEGGAGRDQGP